MRDHTVSTVTAISDSQERAGEIWRCELAKSAVLPATGLMRLACIIGPNGPVPVSKSTWWAGVKSGRYPKPLKLGSRITAWRVEDIRALIQAGFSD